MKAITCTQCGALVKRILLRDRFALCDYCGAKILLSENKENMVEVPDKKDGSAESRESTLTPWQQYLKKRDENALRYAAMNPAPSYKEPNDSSILVPLLVLFLLMGAIVFLAVSGKSCFYRPLDSTEKIAAAKSKSNSPETSAPVFESPRYPAINYQVNVKWNGQYDMEHYENPRIDPAKLPTFDKAQLKKTVFANRAVEVKITIDERGEVSQAKAVSGHPMLKEAAENAARKSLFSPREKPTARVLTYYFRLTD
jgi:DNA-directed RNA polymerase subunit RPC12/RpoP